MNISDPRISTQDASKINQILQSNFDSPSVSVSGGEIASGMQAQNNVCEQVCNTAEQVAIQACKDEFSGLAETICIVAAKAAGDACRKLC